MIMHDYDCDYDYERLWLWLWLCMIMIVIMHDYGKKYLRYNFQLTYFYDARETLVERCIADYPPTLKVAFQFGYILLSLLFTNLNSRLMNYI